MLLGDFTSLTTIDSAVPGLVPKVAGWGKYNTGSPDIYFLLEDFLDIDNCAPEPIQFTTRLAELHHNTASPNGMFGFHVTTCDGKLPHTVAWEESWAVFFARLLRGVLKLDTETNGVWPEMEAAANQVVDKVIPRLLGALQSDGR